MAINDKFEDDIDNLIEVGKEKGYLTYGDVNDMLPEEIGSADDMDDLMTTIGTPGHRSAGRAEVRRATRISSSKRARTSSST